MRQKKFILQEKDIPTQWYNIQAEMPNKPLPPLNPQTHKPMTAEDLSHVFNLECAKQELDTEHAWIYPFPQHPAYFPQVQAPV